MVTYCPAGTDALLAQPSRSNNAVCALPALPLTSLAKGSVFFTPQAHGAGEGGSPTLPEDRSVLVHRGCITSLDGVGEEGRRGRMMERSEAGCPEL